jgi:hypothetical protein
MLENFLQRKGETKSIRYINPQYYSLDINAKPLVSIESDVFRGVDPLTKEAVCLKVYNRVIEGDLIEKSHPYYLEFSHIELYQRLTNHAASIINDNRWTVSFPEISSKKYSVRIESITCVGVIDGVTPTRPCSVMRFVEGPRILEDWPEYGENGLFNPREPLVTEAIIELSREITKKTNIQLGILSNINIKRDDENNIITITDLFGGLSVLKYL